MEVFSKTIATGRTAAFDMIVHTSPQARAVIINIPGFKSDIDGYNNKYRKIGAMLTERGVGAYIQMPNRVHQYKNRELLISDVHAVLRYARTTPELCGATDPEIYISGTSAGAMAAAAVASNPAIKKMLLIAPAYTAERNLMTRIQRELSRFEGELYIAIGNMDPLYENKNHTRYAHIARRASERRVVVIPNCDHYFTGTENGKILSKAPLWAFAADTTFPSPEGGLELY